MQLSVDEERYIRTNTGYYTAVFERLRGRKSRARWNWAAFISPTCWFFYRKVYSWGIAALVISAAICFLGGVVTLALALIFRLVIGLSGNMFYMRHIEDVIRGGTRLREPARSHYVKLRGGTSAVLSVLALVVLIALECLIFHYFYS